MVEIVKRDGERVELNPTKIADAIGKAMLETEKGVDSNLIQTITNAIVIGIQDADEISVEEIQDLVEQNLMQTRPDVAKKYILYREKRSAERSKSWVFTDLQEGIWKSKYRFQDESMDGWFTRVSGGAPRIRKRITKRQFLFGGRILAGRELPKHGIKITYSNCYVLSPPKDSIEDIYDTAKKMARTYSFGGGVGVSLRYLRPRGATVHNASRTTSGSVSFMDLYSLTTGLIGQEGRRGALMLSIPSSHPDLEEFIDVKRDLTKVTKANVSVEWDDAFMLAVKEKREYTLSFTVEDTGEVIEKVVDAYKLFHRAAENNWKTAEPGALFWDRISSYHLMSEDPDFEFVGTNPCAEEPLPAGGSCLLGSGNLNEFVIQPFTPYARFDFNKWIELVHDGIEGLNDVLDEGLELHPLEEQRQSVRDLRQIGFGIMGLADMLIKMGMTYGSTKSLALCEMIAHVTLVEAVRKSALIAKEKGAFGRYKWENIKNSWFFQTLIPTDVKELVEQYGLRNSQLLCIAPTGTISTFLGISGGIEPIFAFGYDRTTESLYKEKTTFRVHTPIVKEYMDFHGLTDESQLPEFFVTAHTLDWRNRIEMQAVWQKYIDASISSTINLHEDVTVEEVVELYLYAWEMGLKGCTIFRDGCERAGILNVTKEEKEDGRPESSISADAGNGSNTTDGEPVATGYFATCPDCNESGTMVHANGCVTCTNCGHSPCA